jgi:uncharacterized membrane protein required for colicin V production
VYFGGAGDYVLAAACSISGFTAFMGFRVGAVVILGSVGAIGAAIAFAPPISYAHEFRFTEWFGTTGLLNRFLCVGVVGLTIALGITGLVILVAGRVFRNRTGLDMFNRWCGFGIGIVEGFVVCVLFLGGMLILDPIDTEAAQFQLADDSGKPFVAKAISSVTKYTRASRLGSFIENNNPFVHFPQLNKFEQVQKSMLVLSNPHKIDQLLNDPAIRELQRRPEVRTVIRKLMDDPEIREILQSDRLMDRSMAMTLLEHPAILELLDQPGFIEEATKVIRETDLISR